jgi:hypothetical protein
MYLATLCGRQKPLVAKRLTTIMLVCEQSVGLISVKSTAQGLTVHKTGMCKISFLSFMWYPLGTHQVHTPEEEQWQTT